MNNQKKTNLSSQTCWFRTKIKLKTMLDIL